MKKRGRPTIYKPEYCDLFIEIMENEGFIETFCVEVGIHTDTYYDWIKRFPAFAVAVKKGKAASKRLFLDRVRDAAWNSEKHKVNNGLIALLAVNCHGLSTNKDKQPEPDEEVKPIDVNITMVDGRKKVADSE